MFAVSDALSNLVGQQNARQGSIKVFEVLQESKANKHLFVVSSAHLSDIHGLVPPHNSINLFNRSTMFCTVNSTKTMAYIF